MEDKASSMRDAIDTQAVCKAGTGFVIRDWRSRNMPVGLLRRSVGRWLRVNVNLLFLDRKAMKMRNMRN